MREIGMVLALAFGVAGGLRAQATSPRVDVTGRAIVLRMARGTPQDIRGELLAVQRDSVWVLAGRPERVVAVRLGDVWEATVRRHGLTAAKGILWGLGVGAASGVGLAVACSQVSDGCGGVAVGSALSGGAVGGVAALSFYFSSRWRFQPVTEVKLEPFARFPQGPPPGGFDALLRPVRDSVVVRP
jgi:hypothetical protein